MVFTNPEVTQILGRVSATQMAEGRDLPLNSALQEIRNNPTALALPESPSSNTVATTASKAETGKNDTLLGALLMGWTMVIF